MLLETFKHFPDFELLDSGEGFRLERWGKPAPRTESEATGTGVILQRPDPQIIWPRSLPAEKWQEAWAIFQSPSGGDKGKWEFNKTIPKPWVISFNDVKFLLKLSPFKHTGIFAEQAANWEWMVEKISKSKFPISKKETSVQNKKLKILNLFAYTGGATMVLAKAGCQVTHVDASKPAITWANENFKLNFGRQSPPFDIAQGEHSLKGNVRWILDDAVKFVNREVKRGALYDGIIMDPPAFGHSPTGKTWKFNEDLPRLLESCIKLLSPEAKFLLINGYATNSSALALNNLLEDAGKNLGGKIEFGELCLRQKSERLISTGIFTRWQKQISN